MKILIINGSPKGDNSITLQTCLYLEKQFPMHTYDTINAGAGIRLYERDFSKALEQIERSDLIVFSYPVYTFLVPSQLHRFIELMKENGVSLLGKCVTQISTSKHFYDVTAHEFIRENVLDLHGHYIRGLSADMEDLLNKKGQHEARSFFRRTLQFSKTYLAEYVKDDNTLGGRQDDTLTDVSLRYSGRTAEEVAKMNIAIVADLAPDDPALKYMIDEFEKKLPCKYTFFNIHDFDFKGGCISCFNCAADGTCIYKDGFSDILRDTVQKCDGIVLAFTIRDHSMGSRFKMYDDRQFCNGHRTVTMGKPFGYLVNGNLLAEKNLQTLIEARAQVGGNYLAGVAWYCEPEKITGGVCHAEQTYRTGDGLIDSIVRKRRAEAEEDEAEYGYSVCGGAGCDIASLADRMIYSVICKYSVPANFYGVGGMKIFRDLIWQMQGFMRADHEFYKEHGQYDFPQKKTASMLAMYAVGGMMRNKKLKTKLGSNINKGMLMPYKKVIK